MTAIKTVLVWLVLCASCWGQMTLAELQQLVDAAAAQAAETNMTQTVMVPDGTWIRAQSGQKLTVNSHVFITTPSGADRSWRISVRDVQPGDAVVSLTGNSFGAGVRGLSITYNGANGDQVTGIRVHGQCKNALIENCHVDLWNRMDCVGLEIRGHESVIVRRFTCRASVPIKMVGGDNHHLSDLDLTAATTEDFRVAMNSEIPSTAVWIDGMPNQWTFSGSFTAQGGDHAFYGRVAKPIEGQVLAIEHLRYEQSLSFASEEKYAIDLKFTDRALERLVLIGCRWGQNRKKGVYVTGCWGVERVGCFLHGTYWWRSSN